MRRHPIPQVLSLIALVALACGLVAGCGGGNIGAGASSSSASTTATRPAGSATATAPAARSMARRSGRSRASAVSAALSYQVHTPPNRRFVAAPIGSSAASQLVKHGAIVVPVAVGGPGKVSAFGQAQIAGRGIVHVAQAAPKTVRGVGIVDLKLRLTPLARAQLAAGRGILMYVAVAFSKGQVIQRLRVPLKP
jgi:hypothetical protein